MESETAGSMIKERAVLKDHNLAASNQYTIWKET